jgi:hypothetical protein
MIRVVLFLLTPIFLQAQSSGHHFFYAGGGGETAEEENQSYRGADRFTSLVRMIRPKSFDLVYDGNHPRDKEFLSYSLAGVPNWQRSSNGSPSGAANLPSVRAETSAVSQSRSPIADFTAQTLTQRVQALVERVRNGEIKSGESILFALDTHGADSKGENKFLVSDKDGLVDIVPILEELKRATESKGIRLGIVSAACYSEPLLKLSGPNTCVITGSDESVGYSHFMGDFFSEIYQNADKNLSLEEVFLRTRKEEDVGSFPQISTSAHEVTEEILSKIKDRMLSYRGDIAQKFSEGDSYCLGRQPVKELISEISEATERLTGQPLRARPFQWSDILDTISVTHLGYQMRYGVAGSTDERDLSRLEESIHNYDTTWKRANEIRRVLDSDRAMKPINVTVDDRTFPIIPLGLASVNRDELEKIADEEKAKGRHRSKSGEPATSYELLKAYDQLKDNSRPFQTLMSAREDYDEVITELEYLGHAVARNERVVYDKIYRGLTKARSESACSKIRF